MDTATNAELARVLADQDGVTNRRQVLACGLNDADLRRLVRRREWVVVHRGVYVDHTGPLTWRQRAWAACLAAWPAALSHDSALRAADGPGRRGLDGDVIHIAVRPGRRALGLDGVRVHALASFETSVRWSSSPPRVRIEEVILDLAGSARDDMDAIGIMADAVGSRRTTAARLVAALDGRARIGRRTFLRAVLTDVASGTHSALEHAFLARVERPHGLPTPRRQRREALTGHIGSGAIYRDAEYLGLGLVVELDGRLVHESSRARDADLDRDLMAKTTGRDTVRLGWGQVVRRPCQTARHLGLILTQRGWTGTVTRCDACPPR